MSIGNIINKDNIKPLAALAGLVWLETLAIMQGIDGVQFGVVLGILGTYLAIKKT